MEGLQSSEHTESVAIAKYFIHQFAPEYAVAVRDATRVCAATLPPEQRTIVDDDGAFRDLEAMRLQLDRIAGDENGARRTPAAATTATAPTQQLEATPR